MSNFKDYAKNRKQNQTENSNGNKFSQEKLPKNAFEMISRLASQYEGASQQDLINAIVAEARKSRKNGTLSDGEIQNFVKTISPMLNSSQRAMLEDIVKKI